MRVSLPLLLLMTASCGGRGVGPGDAGNAGDGDGDSDSDPDAGAEMSCQEGGAGSCPLERPYCCSENFILRCLPQPEWDENDIESWCAETLADQSMVPVDCAHLRPDPSLCPADYPHCCVYLEGEEVCVDHLPVGWRCDS